MNDVAELDQGWKKFCNNESNVLFHFLLAIKKVNVKKNPEEFGEFAKSFGFDNPKEFAALGAALNLLLMEITARRDNKRANVAVLDQHWEKLCNNEDGFLIYLLNAVERINRFKPNIHHLDSEELGRELGRFRKFTESLGFDPSEFSGMAAGLNLLIMEVKERRKRKREMET